MTTITTLSPKPSIALCLQSRHYYCDLLSRSFWEPKLQSRSPPLPSPRGLDTLYVHSITSPPLAACLACLELDLQARTEREREGDNTWEGEGQGYATALGLLNLLTAYRNYVDTSGWKNKARLRGHYGNYRYTNLPSNITGTNDNKWLALKELFSHYDISSVKCERRCFNHLYFHRIIMNGNWRFHCIIFIVKWN